MSEYMILDILDSYGLFDWSLITEGRGWLLNGGLGVVGGGNNKS